jgi:hypothetical protein
MILDDLTITLSLPHYAPSALFSIHANLTSLSLLCFVGPLSLLRFPLNNECCYAAVLPPVLSLLVTGN